VAASCVVAARLPAGTEVTSEVAWGDTSPRADSIVGTSVAVDDELPVSSDVSGAVADESWLALETAASLDNLRLHLATRPSRSRGVRGVVGSASAGWAGLGNGEEDGSESASDLRLCGANTSASFSIVRFLSVRRSYTVAISTLLVKVIRRRTSNFTRSLLLHARRRSSPSLCMIVGDAMA